MAIRVDDAFTFDVHEAKEELVEITYIVFQSEDEEKPDENEDARIKSEPVFSDPNEVIIIDDDDDDVKKETDDQYLIKTEKEHIDADVSNEFIVKKYERLNNDTLEFDSELKSEITFEDTVLLKNEHHISSDNEDCSTGAISPQHNSDYQDFLEEADRSSPEPTPSSDDESACSENQSRISGTNDLDLFPQHSSNAVSSTQHAGSSDVNTSENQMRVFAPSDFERDYNVRLPKRTGRFRVRIQRGDGTRRHVVVYRTTAGQVEVPFSEVRKLSSPQTHLKPLASLCDAELKSSPSNSDNYDDEVDLDGSSVSSAHVISVSCPKGDKDVPSSHLMNESLSNDIENRFETSTVPKLDSRDLNLIPKFEEPVPTKKVEEAIAELFASQSSIETSTDPDTEVNDVLEENYSLISSLLDDDHQSLHSKLNGEVYKAEKYENIIEEKPPLTIKNNLNETKDQTKSQIATYVRSDCKNKLSKEKRQEIPSVVSASCRQLEILENVLLNPSNDQFQDLNSKSVPKVESGDSGSRQNEIALVETSECSKERQARQHIPSVLRTISCDDGAGSSSADSRALKTNSFNGEKRPSSVNKVKCSDSHIKQSEAESDSSRNKIKNPSHTDTKRSKNVREESRCHIKPSNKESLPKRSADSSRTNNNHFKENKTNTKEGRYLSSKHCRDSSQDSNEKRKNSRETHLRSSQCEKTSKTLVRSSANESLVGHENLNDKRANFAQNNISQKHENFGSGKSSSKEHTDSKDFNQRVLSMSGEKPIQDQTEMFSFLNEGSFDDNVTEIIDNRTKKPDKNVILHEQAYKLQNKNKLGNNEKSSASRPGCSNKGHCSGDKSRSNESCDKRNKELDLRNYLHSNIKICPNRSYLDPASHTKQDSKISKMEKNGSRRNSATKVLEDRNSPTRIFEGGDLSSRIPEDRNSSATNTNKDKKQVNGRNREDNLESQNRMDTTQFKDQNQRYKNSLDGNVKVHDPTSNEVYQKDSKSLNERPNMRSNEVVEKYDQQEHNFIDLDERNVQMHCNTMRENVNMNRRLKVDSRYAKIVQRFQMRSGNILQKNKKRQNLKASPIKRSALIQKRISEIAKPENSEQKELRFDNPVDKATTIEKRNPSECQRERVAVRTDPRCQPRPNEQKLENTSQYQHLKGEDAAKAQLFLITKRNVTDEGLKIPQVSPATTSGFFSDQSNEPKSPHKQMTCSQNNAVTDFSLEVAMLKKMPMCTAEHLTRKWLNVHFYKELVKAQKQQKIPQHPQKRQENLPPTKPPTPKPNEKKVSNQNTNSKADPGKKLSRPGDTAPPTIGAPAILEKKRLSELSPPGPQPLAKKAKDDESDSVNDILKFPRFGSKAEMPTYSALLDAYNTVRSAYLKQISKES